MTDVAPRQLSPDVVETAERLCSGSLRFLERTYDPKRALFPYSTTVARGTTVNNFDHPQSLRYTINTLVGLERASHHWTEDAWLKGVHEMIERFMASQFSEINAPADFGLLATLCVSAGFEEGAAASVRRAEEILSNTSIGALNMQDLAWMLWGASHAARTGTSGADTLAHGLAGEILEKFVEPRSFLPRHSIRAYRRNIVSFGSLVYFLRALHEYTITFGERRAETTFRAGVASALKLQGSQGEWPWLIDVRDGRVIDRYPLFAVHQDSMALLFLFPASAAALPGTVEAIDASVRWVIGRNELEVPMFLTDPFVAYRAIERDEPLPRLRRYARALRMSVGRAPAARSAPERLRVNRECRSYHLGWILYVWSRWFSEAGIVEGVRRA